MRHYAATNGRSVSGCVDCMYSNPNCRKPVTMLHVRCISCSCWCVLYDASLPAYAVDALSPYTRCGCALKKATVNRIICRNLLPGLHRYAFAYVTSRSTLGMQPRCKATDDLLICRSLRNRTCICPRWNVVPAWGKFCVGGIIGHWCRNH
jgi:hypothetical protein